MAFDVKKFAEEIGLAEEDRATLFGMFEKNPNILGKVETVFGREVETRLSPLQQELVTKQRDLDAQFDTLASIRGNDGEAIAAAEQRIEKLASERAILETRLRSVAASNGLDAEALLKDISKEAVVPPRVDSPVFDEAKFMAAANRSSLSAFENSALMEDIAEQHRELFGKPMSRVELIGALKETVKRTGNTNLGLKDVWEQKYNVSAKRDEIREADVQKRIDAAVSAAKTAQMDEIALRGQSQTPVNGPNEQSPFFKTFTKAEGVTPVAIQGLPDAVRASMADFARRRAERKTA